MMKVLNLLASGNPGGIESLCNNIDKYSKYENYWVFLFDGGKIANEMKKRNPDNVCVLKYKKYQYIKYIKTINDMCKNYKIDIVNIHHGGTYCNIIYTRLQKMNPNIKFVRSLHSCYEDKYNLKGNFISDAITLHYLNKALRISDLIVCVSNAVKETYEEKFDLKNRNTVVVYNGIGNEFFEKKIANKDKIKNRYLQIIYVGRLVKTKGVDILINAMANLIERNYKVKLTIVGEGTEREYLENLVNDLKIQDNVFFAGTQLNVIEWLDKSDVFVYPSVCKEAFGISVVEAMARGCIPLVSNKGGLPEVVGYDKRFLFNNEEELKDKLEKFIMNKNDVKTQEIIDLSKKFSIENTISKLEGEYIKIKKEGCKYDK